MKILELRFKNLNSLYGEWRIDFTSPEYASSGLFALTGPTGAGKSTILDAICLALYGATPRLGKIQGKDNNEIMSRQTGECYAEVLFESQAGQFRCHWEQRKARKKADGNLQTAEHQIIDANTGKPLQTKKSLVAGIIEEKTGMDFDRFTRSILLAQGGFDTFLKANVEQKSKILEQITGTKIYSEISRRVFERKKSEEQKLELLKAEISGIAILEPEIEKEIQEDLVVKHKKEVEIEKQLSKTDKAIKWLNSINDLKKEIDNLTDESAKLRTKIEAFKPEQAKLNQALKAASLDGTYATLNALRKQQSEDWAALKTEKTKLPELINYANNQAKALKDAEQLTINSKNNLKTEAPLIQKVRALDQNNNEKLKSISELKESCAKDSEMIKLGKQALGKLEKDTIKAAKQVETVITYLNDNAQDEWLISGLTGIKEQFGFLIDRQRQITQKEVKLKAANISITKVLKNLDSSKKQYIANKNKLDEATKKLTQAKNDFAKLLGGKLLQEYRTEKDSLLTEKGYLEKIAALEDHRSKLEDGKPCPLCGATEHPFARGNIPEISEIDQKIKTVGSLIFKAENLETTVNKLENVENTARQKLNDSEKLETKFSNEKISAEKVNEDLRDELESLKDNYEKLKLAVIQKLQPLGITQIPESDALSLLELLKSRLNKWQSQITLKNKIETQITSIDSEKKRLEAVIETQSDTLTEKQNKLDQLQKEYSTSTEERKSLYGDKKPDIEENRLNKAIVNAEKAEKKASNLNIDLQQKLSTAKAHIESLKNNIEQRKSDLNTLESDFSAELVSTGFRDETHFLESRLTNKERESLASRSKDLENAQIELKTRLKDRESCLLLETTKKLTGEPINDLEAQYLEHDKALKELRNLIATQKHKLTENSAAREKIKKKQSTINAQEEEFNRWDKLNYYIGSADGKKYRNFAQGLTFELMVSHANRQLHKMTDRYLLLRDKKEPLELNVIDDYQAGEIRSTKNLSGGESFIVSLSLALGLSKMASRKVRVDSLFLDEGFGTLDENALEIALEALSGLQQNGKVIGMISHVSALKERISTQIAITPLSNGRSSLAGPGCRKLN